ncbi:2Fe-2S iron-sulfur cluster-binding protein [Pontibacter silvestris]|uniref:2Fe-2S iron-sulfur cluster-binding protein n=1 Tax=Pontibacter silvestris TaxID=2305183 RepID=A0ABW4WZC2_9BACT|nr:ferredoxin--NADP reductase [Pontibacter silvestris]MCC9135246.1 ferredoxin--NADP reductase [Pontibacter silvestris]
MTSDLKTLTISDIKEEAKDFKTFFFKENDADRIKYKPGQYLTLLHHSLGSEIRRSYSITSSPALHEPLSIGVKRIENGAFSRFLIDKAKVGDQVLTSGAGGFFTLPEDNNSYKQVYLFAAGSGITPIISLLKTLLYSHPDVAVVLLYSNSSIEKAIYLDTLSKLAAEFPDRFQIEYLYSNAADLTRARLYKDLLQTLVRSYAVAPYENALFYICGPLNYMRMCFYSLRQIDVPLENIRRESFAIERNVPKVAPPDTAAHQVEARFRGNTYNFSAKYPHTILRAARNEGISLPYSCEAGRCGNCVARCVEGKVWMSYNEVLTEKDLAQGLILTCVGHPVDGDVVLDIY